MLVYQRLQRLGIPTRVNNSKPLKFYPERQGPEKIQRPFQIARVLIFIQKSLMLSDIFLGMWSKPTTSAI